jgi:hypothetical protein
LGRSPKDVQNVPNNKKFRGKISGELEAHYRAKGRSNTSKTKKYPTTQNEIDEIIKNALSGIRFCALPIYNARLRSAGEATSMLYSWGEIKSQKNRNRATIFILIKQLIHSKKVTLNSPSSPV